MESVLWKGGGLLAIVASLLWVASFADKHGDTKQLYRDIWGKATPAARLSMALKGGDRLFRILFETKKGRFSWWRSAVATLVASAWLSIVAFGAFARYRSFWLIVGLVAVSTVLPDAVSLLQTRWLIHRYSKGHPGLLRGLSFLFCDLALTTAITVALFPTIYWVAVHPSHLCEVVSAPRCLNWYVPRGANIWTILIKPWSWLFGIDHSIVMGEGEARTQTDVQSWKAVALLDRNTLVACYTGYITSFWLWLTVIGSWLAGVVRWINQRYAYPIITRLKVEEYPCTSLVVLISIPLLLIAGLAALF